MGKIIGIDLGTTNSCVAVYQNGAVEVIANQEGARTTPSIVAFANDGVLVGQVAKRQAVTNPKNTLYSIKRFIGRKHSEVGSEIKAVPYDVKDGPNGAVKVQIGDKQYSPEEISARVLQKLKQAAEDFLGEEIKEAVITVPAYFNDAQRQATKDAGRIAGLEVKRIINEPTAAALAYGLEKKKDEKVAVFDLGGGTFDVSILEIGDNIVEVKATNGDTHLGGDNFDEAVIDWLLNEFKAETGMNLRGDAMALQRLKDAAEKAKIELSSANETEINLPFITADQSGPKHLVRKLSRAKFEQMIDPLVQRTLEPCKRAMADAGLKASDIDEVILVGGSTRVPVVQKLVKDFFGKEPNKSVNPDEVVAAGAAVQGGILKGENSDLLLLDVIPLSLGLETLGGVMTKLIERNTTIPTKKTETFSTAEDNQTSVDVHVLQGERDLAAHNRSLGKFRLDGIPNAPRGVPQIEVTFDVDANGILSVHARDKATGKEQKITVTGATGLDEKEIQKMVKDAEANAEEDRKRKELIDARNELDSFVYNTEKLVKEQKEKVPAGSLDALEKELESAKSALDSGDLARLKEARSKLESASQSVAELLYKSATAASENAGASAPGETVVDAGPGSPKDVN